MDFKLRRMTMKTQLKTGLVMLVIFISPAYAVDFNAGLIFGTIKYAEEGKGSSKFLTGFGLGLASEKGEGLTEILGFGKEYQEFFEFEYLTRAEPGDEDFRSPSSIITVSGEVTRDLFQLNKTKIYAIAGLNYKKIERTCPQEGLERLWGDLNIGEGDIGLGLEYEKIRFEGRALLPFWTDIDSSQELDAEPGFGVGLFVPYKKFDIEFSYSQMNIKGSHDSRLELLMVRLIYNF